MIAASAMIAGALGFGALGGGAGTAQADVLRLDLVPAHHHVCHFVHHGFLVCDFGQPFFGHGHFGHPPFFGHGHFGHHGFGHFG